MINRTHTLSIVRQAKLLGLSRAASIIRPVLYLTAIWR
jgi:hypothetical protein